MTILTRAQIRPGVLGIDTTVKSAQELWRAFAPRWEMVIGYKNGHVSEANYTEQYEEILERVPANVWDRLADGETQTLLCYCRDGWFCHTHLIIAYAIEHWPELFRDGRAPGHIPSKP
jgi:hypothetical protein